MQIEITCNTPDEKLFGQIAFNSRANKRWVKQCDPHIMHAVIVGGGPSLADNLHLIRKRQALGQQVFALNGAAKFLNAHGIRPNYQVILDARPENALLVDDADEYLIASQCHPWVFEACPDATLWHPALEGIDAHLPEYPDDYALIGHGSTVGLSAMALAFALGYRKLHLFGYDSSHRDTLGHAYPQSLNDRDPLCKVTLGDKTFTSSWTMARQAERFPDICNNLITAGCVITCDGDGLIMEVLRQMARTAEPIAENEKYRQMWALPQYRVASPGERTAEDFVSVAYPEPEDRIIDFGCGTGRGGKRIHALTGCDVTLVDFAANCRDKDNNLPFVLADLTKPMGLRGDIGYCTDVLEHIPPADVPAVITNIMDCVDACYFRIALFHDNMGALIGHPLHLSVFPADWWAEQFNAYEIPYRDDDENSELQTACFYVKHKKKD